MALKFSMELRRQMLVGGSLKHVLDGGVLRLYSGPVPASADSVLSGNDLLVEILAAGQSLTFEGNASNAVLTKSLDQVWQSDVLQNGTPTFFRYVLPADTGGAGSNEVRIQGTVGGPSADMTVTSTVLTQGNPHRIEYFAISLPESG